MARVTRSSLPDGFFHVFARAVDGSGLLFRDDHDRTVFMRLLSNIQPRYAWTCHAVCLMSTHYHLVLEARQPQLSRGMQRLNGCYGRAFNVRYGRFGALFANRFGARVIEGEEYLFDACTYVVLNPVRAGLCDRASDWPWSYSSFGLDGS